ncbi:aspartate aminotransferase family protein [Bacillus sonorensis]|uniref:Diaminobutyrate--2-oxoglutarate transaminase n=2 Tax=Bacillus sonorensis TaxID=119858 RepID=M5P7T9_9BACI|nr:MULTISPECIES: aspartate aminotransferase family protein [Bacillus]TWK72809.1 Diaminobutyrate--2-oxoglutarate aminotransferase [Bacillus paralicheniformis]ASB90162.1 Diaminobutyrate--2-oxoglutarate transaminase [Bacillus sonorensis]EME76066.1 diaminobutyrate--2-oxoglutarate aminotransferase [Bacillus sonorensis L12]MCZ0074532.1 aspartate aminotransferase family protein [Bacillus sonorensis]MCZ0093640.1 aspartate aminotransferase family protein [Bacillus sonorensis]
MSVQTSSKNQLFLEQQNKRESNARSYPRRFPLAMQTAEGIFVKDADGKQYYDCLAGAGTLALGHNHPVVIEAIQKMIDEKRPLHTLDITSEIKEEFISEVFASLPESFAKRAKIQFCGPTGGDAIEAAIKLVKTATGKRSILSFHGGYHGATHGTMALSGNLSPKEHVHGLMPDVHFLPYPYEYRCPFGAGGEETHRLSSAYIEHMLDDPESGILQPAGMIFEAVQGEGGSVPAPVEWIKEMRRITKERGIPLIVDEVQTGIGRTGKMFAFEHAGIIPDVIVLSKAIGGSLPLSVVIYDRDLDQWGPGAHIGTFRGNQMAMAAGTATLKYVKEHDVLSRVEKAGAKLMQHLKDVQRDVPEIGDVRGRGLMIGAEIVSPFQKQSKNGSFPADPELAAHIQRKCFEKGLIVETGGRHGSVIRFLPPLIVTEEQIDDIAAIFKEAVYEAVK